MLMANSGIEIVGVGLESNPEELFGQLFLLPPDNISLEAPSILPDKNAEIVVSGHRLPDMRQKTLPVNWWRWVTQTCAIMPKASLTGLKRDCRQKGAIC